MACRVRDGVTVGLGALAAAAELHLYAGAGLREPVEVVVSAFEKQSGHRVTVEYGGSGQLLTRINLTRAGDLFLPGSADYVERLRAQGRVAFSAPLVLHTPVMVVRRDTGARWRRWRSWRKAR